MRVVGVLIGASVMMMGAANASSFVLAPAPTGKISQSFVHVGLPAPVENHAAGSRSPFEVARGTTTPVYRHAPSAGRGATSTSGDTASPEVPLAFALPDMSGPTIRQVSPSIIAFDESFPAVAFEKVAAISVGKPKPLRRRLQTVAMLIRGGIVESGVSGSAAPVTAASVKATAKGATATSTETDIIKGGARLPEPLPEPEKPAIAPPPPNMPRLGGPE